MRTAPVALAYLDDEDALVEAAPRGQRAHPLRPRRRRGLRAVVPARSATRCSPASSTSRRAAPPRRRPPRAVARRASTPPSRRARPTSPTTAGSSRRCRPPGRRSPPPRSRPTTRAPASSAPTTCGWRSTRPCGAAATPTPSRPSPAGCSARPTARRPCRRSGAACCTAGRASARTTWSSWPRRSNATARPTGSTSATRGYGAIDALARHPYDDGVRLGGIGVLRELPDEVDAVVSLCRVGDADVPPTSSTSRSGSSTGRSDENPNLDFVLHDTVRAHRAAARRGPHRAGALRPGPQPHADDRRALRHAPAYGVGRGGARTSTDRPARGVTQRRLPCRAAGVRRGDMTSRPVVGRAHPFNCAGASGVRQKRSAGRSGCSDLGDDRRRRSRPAGSSARVSARRSQFAHRGDCPGAAAASTAKPASVSTATWPRRSVGQSSRRTQPRSSSRATACESRLREDCVASASSLIRMRRPGASDSRTRIS